MFLSSVAVFFTEIVKLVICVFAVCYEEQGYSNCMTNIFKQVVAQPFDTLKVCIPAVIYTVQNNLFYLAATHLDAAAFMV
uniref:Uncharacterized protein n=1 Tax=Plectus sambesii TaxID=2011161 RepID=A0A914WSB4_9BILA